MKCQNDGACPFPAGISGMCLKHERMAREPGMFRTQSCYSEPNVTDDKVAYGRRWRKQKSSGQREKPAVYSTATLC